VVIVGRLTKEDFTRALARQFVLWLSIDAIYVCGDSFPQKMRRTKGAIRRVRAAFYDMADAQQYHSEHEHQNMRAGQEYFQR